MSEPAWLVSTVAAACGGTLHTTAGGDPVIRDLLIDSRRLIHPEHTLFIALVTERNDGHRYIAELYEKGVRCFLISAHQHISTSAHSFDGAFFILVPDTLAALQKIGTAHRHQFDIPVIGVTGSNGKTIVKEWLFQLLSGDYSVIRSPKSYNSQTGVPLSVWKIAPWHTLAVFEAGISQPGEMARIAPVIDPTIGIFTNIGTAHDEYFADRREKILEKLELFRHAKVLVYCADQEPVRACIEEAAFAGLQCFTWSRRGGADLQITGTQALNGTTRISGTFRGGEVNITIPFTDEASVENAIHCLAADLALFITTPGGTETATDRIARHAPRYAALTPVAMRLELREAINHCSLINDSYNSDINSLSIALDFLNQQNQHRSRTVILSDLLQTGREKGELYREISSMLVSRNVTRIIGIGRDLVRNAGAFPMEGAFFSTTDEFLQQFPLSSFQNETILLKGARPFEFEKISQALQQKAHETVLEINIDAMVHNLNHYRSLLAPGVRTMAMVKAFSYGSGSFEIANVLQFHHVDYLAVAYADEGVELRRAGIRLPVMVMSPEEQSLDTLLKYNLEPEVYNLHILGLLEEAIVRNQTSIQQEVRIHIKLDTGMHRLGFDRRELEPLLERLRANPALRVQSVFSHLAASEDPSEDRFTREQIALFDEMSRRVTGLFDYPVLRHILNSAGIARFSEAQFDMVRLGIGLYGVAGSAEEQPMLRNVSTLKSVVTQVRLVPAGETIGYNRKGKTERDTVVAVVPVGYADGLNRRLGNGNGALFIHGMPAPVIGNVCMDLVMVDVTGIVRRESSQVRREEAGVREGDEVVIFGDGHPVAELAKAIGTIPYEVLTGISRRVKRVYYYE